MEGKSRRGGKRPGAGRKPKAVSPTALIGTDLKAALDGEIPDAVDSVAAEFTRGSIAALIQQLLHGESDAAKIDAANAILDRGYGKPTVEAGADPMLPFLGRAPVRNTANEVRDEARRYARVAVAVLDKIQHNGLTEAIRVRAARALLDRGLGTVTPARMPATFSPQPAQRVGKKEEASATAKAAASGRLATPAPPPRLN
jgi:hypothetical protein